jgi:hypothetical protein
MKRRFDRGVLFVLTFWILLLSSNTYALIIDPLVYSTYLSGSMSDGGRAIAVDRLGSVYVTGETESSDFTTATGSPNTVQTDKNAFVVKLSPEGRLVYSTYIGGSGFDSGYSIAVNDAGAVYVTGDTASPDFPVSNPLEDTLGGLFDAFLVKLDEAGEIAYSTYLGGSDLDFGRGIAVNTVTGAVYVTGETRSSDFYIFNAPKKTILQGPSDAFVTQLDVEGKQIIYSTYLGGSESDTGLGIAVDQTGAVYVTGETLSKDFPKTPKSRFGGKADAFVTRFYPTGAIDYSIYLGGEDIDSGLAVAVDEHGIAFITGETQSGDFPLIPSVGATACAEDSNAFVARLDPSGYLAYSKCLGGSGADTGHGIAVDKMGFVSLTGHTDSPDFPVTADAFDKTLDGSLDAFVARLDPEGNRVNATYLGGADNKSFDSGLGIAVNQEGMVYITGVTGSNDFPTTTGAIGTGLVGHADAFVVKMAFNVAGLNPTDPISTPVTPLGNREPSTPLLKEGVMDATGFGATVTFIWEKSTDPDGDPVAYQHCLRVGNNRFNDKKDCQPVTAAGTSFMNQKTLFTGLGISGLLSVGLLLMGGAGRHRSVMMGMIVMVAFSLLLSCGKDDVSVTKPAPDNNLSRANEVRFTVSELPSNTTFFWKVIAEDGKGGRRESPVRELKTL